MQLICIVYQFATAKYVEQFLLAQVHREIARPTGETLSAKLHFVVELIDLMPFTLTDK